MKVTSNTTVAPYKPVTLNLTFETKDELDHFGALFNIYDVMAHSETLLGMASAIRGEVIIQGGDVSKHHSYHSDAIQQSYQKAAKYSNK